MPKKKRLGRPPKSQTVKNQVCEYIAEGKTIKQIMKLPGMPVRSTINDWRLKDAEFSNQYARARQIQADIHIEEIEELSHNLYTQSQDAYDDENVRHKPPSSEMVAALKLLVDTRKWIASKAFPKVYGDVKVPNEEQGERTITIVIDSDDAKA